MGKRDPQNKGEVKEPSHMTVKELIKILFECNPDASVFSSLYSDASSVDKVYKVKNHGNYIQIIRSK